MLNRLTGQIADICRAPDLLFKEKWLVAPTRRVGYQWLDSVALAGCSPFNFHVKTFRSLTLDLAAAAMKESATSLADPVQNEVLLGRVLGKLRKPEGEGYLLGLRPGPGLTSVLSGSIRDLRLAGLTAGELKVGDFYGGDASRSLADKAGELISILKCYEAELSANGLVDYAGALRLALSELDKADASGVLVLVPADLVSRLASLENRLLEALPFEKRTLEVDGPGDPTEPPATDLDLLRYMNEPADAPAPFGDGTVEVFRAVGEVNEVREVLRRCASRGIPLDDVEIVCSDSATYVPLIYEVGSVLAHSSAGSELFTFSDGIPVRYSRPARALLGWLEWVRDGGYPQWVLERLIQGGLLAVDGTEEGRPGFARLARQFRSLPIYASRDRYLAVIDGRIRAVEAALSAGAVEIDEDDDTLEASRARYEQELEGLKSLRVLVIKILGDSTPAAGPASQKRFLDDTHAFLSEVARAAGEFDEYCVVFFVQQIEELAGYLAEGDVEGFDVAGWLESMAGASSVGGSGPRPGRAYITSLRHGGHSGRGNTFIVGLDDSRFPGAGLEDPVLLDGERETISASRGTGVSLPTAAARLSRDVKEEFAGLLARLRGRLSLSYCSLDLVDDREMFPSRALLSACRIASGRHEAGYGQILRWKPLVDPASFAPAAELDCLEMGEWWLWLAAASGLVADRSDLEDFFPNLARGEEAAARRRSSDFTEYDGFVPQAGKDFLLERPVLSATALELLGKCPMEYFFKYMLGIEPLEEHLVDPYRWLPYDKTGSLLHSVFRDFMSGLQADECPSYEAHHDAIQKILDERVAVQLARYPNLSQPGVYEREVEDMKQTAIEFLLEMEQACTVFRPRYFEVGIGMPPRGSDGETLCPDPVELRVSPELTIAARGCLDRIDVETTAGGTRYTIWDYKTGRSNDYDARDPFRKGRQVQSALYMRLLAEVLEASGERGEVSGFVYFFPRRAEHRRRVSVGAGEVPGGLEMIGHLAGMLAQGSFPVSDDSKDMQYSEYKAAFGDLDTAARMVRGKRDAEGNESLEHFKGLRGTGRRKASGKGK